MQVRIEIKGREFTLSWAEFERISAKNSLHNPITILQIREFGGAHAAA